eukprot:2210084-Karenia_brevis.AAC.1
MATDVIEVVEDVLCAKDMCQCGEVEVGDADAHIYLPEPTGCESLAGAEYEMKRKWRKPDHSGAVRSGL